MSSTATMNDVVKQAAATTKHVAASTAHTLSNLVGEAQDKIGEMPLPTVTVSKPKRKRTGRRRMVLVLAALAAAGAFIARRKGQSDQHDTPQIRRDDEQRASDVAKNTDAAMHAVV